MKFIYRLNVLIPEPLRLLLKRLGLQSLLNRVISKKQAEMVFQSIWVVKFKKNRAKTLEYFRKYVFLDRIINICIISDKSKILDIGCGISTVLHFIKGERYGIDPLANEYLRMYKYPKDISIQRGVGEKIPFTDNFFDIIFCLNVLDHTDNPEKVIREVKRVLKIGGFFILDVHIFEKYFKRDPAHPQTFVYNDIRSLVNKGFNLIFEKFITSVSVYDFTLGKVKERENKDLLLVLKKVKS